MIELMSENRRLFDELMRRYDAMERVIASAKRVRLVWMAMAGKAPPDEIQLAVALADLTAHLDTLPDLNSEPQSRSQAIRFAVQRGEPVPSFDKEKNPDSGGHE